MTLPHAPYLLDRDGSHSTSPDASHSPEHADTDADALQRPGSPRKKKAYRACRHCQRAHLTCDDERPCRRCIKRGISTTCCDGLRKVAKYLQEEELRQSSFSSSSSSTSPHPSCPSSPTPPSPKLPQVTSPSFVVSHLPLHPMSSSSSSHLSPKAESDLPPYGLSPLLPTTSATAPSTTSPPGLHTIPPANLTQQAASTAGTVNPPSLDPNGNANSNVDAFTNILLTQGPDAFGSEYANLEYAILSQMLANPQLATAALEHSFQAPSSNPSPLAPEPATFPTNPMWSSPSGAGSPAAPSYSNLPYTPTHPILPNGPSLSVHPSPPQPLPGVMRPEEGSALTSAGSRGANALPNPQSVYASIQSPFDYTEGFHHLLEYIKLRIPSQREGMMRICRAVARIRPSLIALIMGLTRDDLVLMERCFQRTLLEFEKLVGFSGTPTIVWRRTGEIALVGKEFSLLTGWSREELLHKRSFIYELMEERSAVDYWERFAVHAFDHSQQPVMSVSYLKTPEGRSVPCAFCFTIKRDVFDVPLAIVGNFLPILR